MDSDDDVNAMDYDDDGELDYDDEYADDEKDVIDEDGGDEVVEVQPPKFLKMSDKEKEKLRRWPTVRTVD